MSISTWFKHCSNFLPLLSKPHWMESNADLNDLVKEYHFYSKNFNLLTENPDKLKEFHDIKAISFVFTSNKLEDTIPRGFSEDQIFKLLSSLTKEDLNCQNILEKWNIDGINDNGLTSKAQLLQHLKAYYFLIETSLNNINMKSVSHKKLTKDTLIQIHQILVAGAVDNDGVSIKSGSLRNIIVHAGEYVYLDHTLVESSLDKALQQFNEDIQNKTKNPIEIAVNLFYDVITIHPFEDGNGRLCHLLATYVFHSCGFPLPVLLSSGHSKSRNHYMHSILYARRSNRNHLNSFFLTSLLNTWRNYNHYRGNVFN